MKKQNMAKIKNKEKRAITAFFLIIISMFFITSAISQNFIILGIFFMQKKAAVLISLSIVFFAFLLAIYSAVGKKTEKYSAAFAIILLLNSLASIAMSLIYKTDFSVYLKTVGINIYTYTLSSVIIAIVLLGFVLWLAKTKKR